MSWIKTQSSRRRVAIIVPAALAAGLVGVASADGALKEPTVSLVAASPTAVALRFDQGGMYSDLGTYLTVGKDMPLEIRVSRSKFSDPIVADLVIGAGSQARTRRLPAGMVTFNGLNDFVTTTVTDSAGTRVSQETQSICPVGGGMIGLGADSRNAPDAPQESPYPYGCNGSPFAYRTSIGLQRGWAATIADQIVLPDLPLGSYQVKVQVAGPWRKALRMTVRQSTANLRLEVRKAPEDGVGPVPGARLNGPGLQRIERVPASWQRAIRAGHVDGLTPPSAPGAGVLGAGGLGAGGLGGSGEVAPNSGMTRALAAEPRAVPNSLRPDLRSLPAYGVTLIKGEDGIGGTPGHEYLAFAATVWNAGPGRLTVEGFRAPGADVMDAYQVFVDANGAPVSSVPRGTMQYDPRQGHEHWHFTDFATYRLLSKDGATTIRSQKEAFCLAPTDQVDLLVKGAQRRIDSIGLFSACGGLSSLGIREVLPTGWGDTYGQFLAGQSIDITDLPNGEYFIQVLANPEKNLLETSTANNESRRLVILGGKPGARTVTVPPIDGLDIP